MSETGSPKPNTPLPDRLSQPAQRALASAGITCLEDLANFKEKDVAKLHGLGPGAMVRLRGKMAEHGLDFEKTE